MDSESNISTPIIAREGWVHIAISLLIALVGTWLFGWWASPFWVIVIFVLQFFRDPPREIPSTPNVVVSPADGKVVFCGPAQDPYLNRSATKISIFMNVFSVHANRSPVKGLIKEVWYHPGRFVNAALDKASEENERNALWVNEENGRDIVFVQVAGLIARRILCYVKKGDNIDRGQRYGFIRFGSRVDVYLSPEFEIKLGIGDQVKAGCDILGSY